MDHRKYMEMAIELAKKGAGHVSPNPLVGAVIVKDGRVIGQGYHEYYGGLHAERNALKNCVEFPKDAVMYVTLEPCCHYGKTPPCTEAIIESGISKVVIGTLDVNPKVAGKGADILKSEGIQVEVGVMETECKRLTRVFRKFITTEKPYVLLKYAMTMDGKTATFAGHSRWITGEEARKQVHSLRNELSAIMVGVNTIIYDNPLLTCRLEGMKNPIRIVCDTNLITPLSSQIVKTSEDVITYIATACTDEKRKELYRQAGCRIIEVEKKDSHIDLEKLMEKLGAMGIDSILLESGGSLSASALKAQIVDEIHAYIAPKIFGGIAQTPVAGEGVEFPDEAYRLHPVCFSQIGEDFLIESEVIYPCSQEL